MDEQEKKLTGDGNDDLAGAAKNTASAIRQFVKQAAGSGMQTAAGAKVGALAGGPWGAVIAAAWSMRHTLFRILVVIGLLLLILVIFLSSIPSILVSQTMDSGDPEMGLEESYQELSGSVDQIVQVGYVQTLAEVERIILDNGYDYEHSMDALINHAQSSAGYDVSYILAAYSASLQQQDTTEDDLISKLSAVTGAMFPVTYEVKTFERIVPVSYQTYEPVIVTVAVTQLAGIVNGIPRFNYILEDRTYYVPGETKITEESVTTLRCKRVEVQLPVYMDGEVTGTESGFYYEAIGEHTVTPEFEEVEYAACTIYPFNTGVITTAFGLDLSAEYPQFPVTYGEAITKMTYALKMTLYGTYGSGQSVPLTDTELLAFVNIQNCSPMRKHILTTALSLVGKVPYFWGGKSEPGWNDEWNTPKLVTSAGSSSTGTIRPYGLDCSGFSDWVYKTAVGISLYGTNWSQWDNSYAISSSDLLPGDLGFLMNEDGAGWNHVLLFAGYSAEGERMWVHCTSGKGVVLNHPRYEASLRLRRPKYVDFDAPVSIQSNGEPLYALEVDVTHYCACSLCCGNNANGYTASGKPVVPGMVAMSSNYPFGTQIMIGGIMYTVEDRGGSGIENDITRVDIFVPDHNEALRRGRYSTTAYIYRIGR